MENFTRYLESIKKELNINSTSKKHRTKAS